MDSLNINKKLGLKFILEIVLVLERPTKSANYST
jgi:hypothetical protein